MYGISAGAFMVPAGQAREPAGAPREPAGHIEFSTSTAVRSFLQHGRAIPYQIVSNKTKICWFVLIHIINTCRLNLTVLISAILCIKLVTSTQ